MSYPSKNSIYLKLVYTSLSNQIKFENHKSSLPLKSFIVCLSTALKHNVKHNEDPALKREASLRRFLRKLKEKTFLTKMYVINCILLVLLLLLSMVLLNCTSFPPVIHFLNIVRLLHPKVLLILILPVSFVISFHP